MAVSTLAPSPNTRSGPSGLADVLDVLLDKGLVVDAFVRVSLVGIELLTIDIRIVVASVDTYLRFAEAVNRLDLYAAGQSETLPQLFRGGGKEEEAEGAVEGVREALGRGKGKDKDEQEEPERSRSRRG
ncbi:MAG: gas vesicle protein GvpJ [Actinomycetota bacterium]